MADVATATTADADQTRATGSRILGYYLGSGGVKVDALHDVANFLTKDANGNVGLGIPTPAHLLHIVGDTPSVRVAPTASDQTATLVFGPGANNDGSLIAQGSTGSFTISVGRHASWGGNIRFMTDTTEKMRLTAEGRLGIGTVTPAEKLTVVGGNILLPASTDAQGAILGYSEFYPAAVEGVSVPSYGLKWASPAGGGNPVAILSGYGGAWIITGGSVQLRVFPSGIVSPGADNSQPLGAAAHRWSVVYAGTGAINTSDAREKAWRGAASAAELAAAKRIAAELGFYQWNDAIAEKGEDGARLHFGVQAQAVWAIMADEGLVDPIVEGVKPDCRYAFLCYDEWDTVEAVDEVRDEEGNVVSPAVPAQPGGNRFGVRPDQLALFLIAAQEARLAALEAAS